MNGFPTNPRHGDTVEVRPGLSYTYDGFLKSWAKIEGSQLTVATASLPGLMSSSDYSKLDLLVIPPPRSTITSEHTEAIIDGGIIGLRSGDNFVMIDCIGPAMNKAAGIDDTESLVFGRKLHQYTYSFDMYIDTDAFFTYMAESGKLVIRSIKGPEGPPGDRGIDGADVLSYGEDGKQGPAGSNAPFNLSLQSEVIEFERKDLAQRAITKIEADTISRDENYIVVTRSNIGNPEACPSLVKLGTDVPSNWVVATAESNSNQLSWYAGENCVRCNDLYYLDISTIIDAIHEEFEREVMDIKHDMEQIAAFWLNVMSGLFDEQKAALCCALEYCKSQSRNAETRRYIEQARIQAAQTQTLTGITYEYDTSGNQVGASYTSKGHSVVIDGDPENSGKSVIVRRPMDVACKPGGFGTANSRGLPNSSDPTGGSNCVPGVALINGESILYDDCPPGFIPRDRYRDFIKGKPYEGENRTYPADYTPETSPFDNVPPGVDPGVPTVPYSPYGPGVTGRGIDARRSNNPATSAAVRIIIDGSTSPLRSGVAVVIKDRAGGRTYVSGTTSENGVIIFHNLSINETYLIELSKAGQSFAPSSFADPELVVGDIVELTSITTETADSSDTYTRRSCGSGGNQLHISISGDDDYARMAYVRLYNYYDGVYRCGGQSGPGGEIRFSGLGFGKYVIVASVLNTPSYTYQALPACSPGSPGTSTFLDKLRRCTTVTFDESDGQQLLTASFRVVATPAISPASMRVEIITPDKPTYKPLVVKQKVQLEKRSDLHAPIELEFASQHPGYEIFYVPSLGAGTGSQLGGPKRSATGSKIIFSDMLVDGAYYLCLVNRSGAQAGFKLTVNSKLAKFVAGSGKNWSNDFLKGNVLDCPSGPEPGESLWVKMVVEVPQQIQAPYSVDCGAVGPRPSNIDRRICRELPTGRKTGAVDGRLEDWTPAVLDGTPVPDALVVDLPDLSVAGAILCRIGPANYSGGWNTKINSYQLLVEQVSGRQFKVTVLEWASGDCSGDVSAHGSAIIAVAEGFTFGGSLKLGDRKISFSIAKHDNTFELSGDTDYLLTLDGKSPDQYKSTTVEVPKGNYVVDIVGCCIRSGKQYTGHVELQYNVLNGVISKKFPYLGSIGDERAVRSAYAGLTMNIEHYGGPITAKLAVPLLLPSQGSVTVRLSAVDKKQPVIKTSAQTGCRINIGYLKWLKEGWEARTCQGAVISVLDQDYIILRRSGRVGNVPCSDKFPDAYFAWPTLDGKDFEGLPNSGSVSFDRDVDLEFEARAAIEARRFSDSCGDVSSVNIILFPLQ